MKKTHAEPAITHGLSPTSPSGRPSDPRAGVRASSRRRRWWQLSLSTRLSLVFGLLGMVAISASLAYSFFSTRAAMQTEINVRLDRHHRTVSALLDNRLKRLDIFLQSVAARRAVSAMTGPSLPIEAIAEDLSLVFQEVSVGADVDVFFVLNPSGIPVIENGRLDLLPLLPRLRSPVQYVGGWRLESLPTGHVLLKATPVFDAASLHVLGYLFVGLSLSDSNPFVKEWFDNTTLDWIVLGHRDEIILIARRPATNDVADPFGALWNFFDLRGLYVRETPLVLNDVVDPVWVELGLSRAQLTALLTGHLLTAVGLSAGFLLLVLLFAAFVKVNHDRAISRLTSFIRAVQAGERGLQFQETSIYEYNRVGYAMQRMVEDLHVAAAVFDSADGMIVTDHGLHVLRCNRAFTAMTGYAMRTTTGQHVLSLLTAQTDTQVYQPLYDMLQAGGAWRGDIEGIRADGSPLSMRVSISEVRGGPDQHVMNYVITVSDISQQRADAARIQQLAYFDPLTGLPNRRLQMERLGNALADSALTQQFGAIIYIDLDDFKSLNDTRGHATGDRLLIEVAQRLASAVRQGDSVARMGGDEFVVVLQHMGTERNRAERYALDIATAMLENLRRVVEFDDGDHRCTASIGLTLFCGDELSIQELLQQADLAMYEAKAEGRNMVRVFQPTMHATALQRVSLEQELRRALINHEFSLYYQPIWDGESQLVGAEALLRWLHHDGVIRSGGEFIPIAERSGLILPLGTWVLNDACRTLAQWSRDDRLSGLTLSVNVSVKQFQQPDFVQIVSDALHTSGCPPTQLYLELTESIFMDVRDGDINKMNQLRSLGVRFSLDDFGTGYSSLSYLKRLPLDTLKIDRYFVNDLDEDPKAVDFVKTIITLAQALQLDVVAEGVETVSQKRLLAECGCQRFQGYLMGRPVPLKELLALAESPPSTGDTT